MYFNLGGGYGWETKARKLYNFGELKPPSVNPDYHRNPFRYQKLHHVSLDYCPPNQFLSLEPTPGFERLKHTLNSKRHAQAQDDIQFSQLLINKRHQPNSVASPTASRIRLSWLRTYRTSPTTLLSPKLSAHLLAWS